MQTIFMLVRKMSLELCVIMAMTLLNLHIVGPLVAYFSYVTFEHTHDNKTGSYVLFLHETKRYKNKAENAGQELSHLSCKFYGTT